jgi:hypothetical protein
LEGECRQMMLEPVFTHAFIWIDINNVQACQIESIEIYNALSIHPNLSASVEDIIQVWTRRRVRCTYMYNAINLKLHFEYANVWKCRRRLENVGECPGKWK